MTDGELESRAGTSGPSDESDLVHMLYDAVVDNSLWPDMVSELIEYVERIRDDKAHEEVNARLANLVQHFQRAVAISQSFVELQERHSALDGVLNTLALGISLFDHAGRQIYANDSAKQSNWGSLSLNQLQALKNDPAEKPAATGKQVPALVHLAEDAIALVSIEAIKNDALPANVSYLAIALPGEQMHMLESVKHRYYLSSAETRLLRSFYSRRNIRGAAHECNLTYESARTYLKRIYSKTGTSDQAGLLALLDLNPVSLVTGIDPAPIATPGIRQSLQLKDGRQLEYFDLGPRNGQILLHFDALTGVAIDTLGTPETYRPVLEALNLRLITPCRPGTFGSDFKRMLGLSEWTPDILELLDHLGVERAVLLSQAFGSCSALAFAATAPDRVERAILCAPAYPDHEPNNWRKMDIFYIISGVIGRRAPALMRAIIPFLMRSVMQNTRQYLERHIARSNCPADIAVLSSPQIHPRIPQMLALRTMTGTAGLVQENYLNTHGWDFLLEDITAPVFILQGQLDNVSDPTGSRKLAAALPAARLHQFPDLGQYLIFTEWPWILELCAGGQPKELDGPTTF